MATPAELAKHLLDEWHKFCIENKLPWNPDGDNYAFPKIRYGIVMGYVIYWDQWIKPIEYEHYNKLVQYFLKVTVGDLYDEMSIDVITRS